MSVTATATKALVRNWPHWQQQTGRPTGRQAPCANEHARADSDRPRDHRQHPEYDRKMDKWERVSASGN